VNKPLLSRPRHLARQATEAREHVERMLAAARKNERLACHQALLAEALAMGLRA
jgi:hypothetical protein